MEQCRQPRKLLRGDRVAKENGGKMATKSYVFPLDPQSSTRSTKDKQVVQDRFLQLIKPCLHVARFSTLSAQALG